MNWQLRKTQTPTALATTLLLSAMFAAGCRGNLGSAMAVASGQANVASIEAASMEKAANTAMHSPAGHAGVNPASFSPDSPSTQGAPGGSPAALGSSANLFAAVDPATGNPTTPPSREEAFAAILPELQRLAEANPAAQQALLSQMQTAEPEHWPLLVRRLKADLAVSAQLNREDQSTTPASHHKKNAQGSATRSLDRPQSKTTLPPAETDQQSGLEFPNQTKQAPPNLETPAHFAPPPRKPMATLVHHDEPTDPAAAAKALIQLASAQSPIDASTQAAMANSLSPSELSTASLSSNSMAPIPMEWREALQQAIAGLDAEAPSHPQSAGEAYQHARLRLLQLASGDLNSAATAIPGLSSTEQSYWSHQMFAIAKLMDDQSQPETKRRAAAANLHLANAAAELSQLSSLSVRSLTFCNEVYGYGAYDPVKSAKFRPSELLTLYAEVEHYKSVSTKDGRHTSLASSYRIVDEEGSLIDEDDFPLVEDYCLSPRRDFHIQYYVPLPAGIKAGEYRLELSIEDQLGNKRGYASTDFSIETSRR